MQIFLTILLSLHAHAHSDPNAANCDDKLALFASRLSTRLERAGVLTQNEPAHALIKPVTVRLRSDAWTWDLATSAVQPETSRDPIPAALVTKASGDVIIVLYPSGDARELLRTSLMDAEVSDASGVIGTKTYAGYASVSPTRPAPQLKRHWGFAQAASVLGEPVIAWSKREPAGRKRWVISTYEGDIVPTDDPVILELNNGSCVVIQGQDEVALHPRASALRDLAAFLPASVRQDFVRRYWRTLHEQLIDFPIEDMKLGRLTDANLNGDPFYRTLVGPVHLGRSRVIVIDPRTKTAVRPDETLKLFVNGKGRTVRIERAQLDDGRALRPEPFGWSVNAVAGGEPTAAPAVSPTGPSRGPGGIVRLRQVLHTAE